MIYRGRDLDVLSLWGQFVDLPPGLGEPLPSFLPKVVCPNPKHDTFKRHFQVNTKQARVHCFAHCGVSGSYEHALCVVLGIYDKREVTADDIEWSKVPRESREPAHIAAARARVWAAQKEARKLLLKHTRASLGKIDVSAYAGHGKRKTVTSIDAVAHDEAQLRGGHFQYLPREVREYLDARGIDASSRGKWQIGYSEDEERIIIPAYDERGTFRFLIKRAIKSGGSLKYLYTEGAIKTSILFGACFLDPEQVRPHGLVLCEGSLDVIRLHQLGVTNAVAILGTGLSKRQVRIIDKYNPKRIYLFYDKDSAGVDNIRDAKEKLHKAPLFVCRFPKGKADPAELMREEADRSINRALPIHTFFSKTRIAA